MKFAYVLVHLIILYSCSKHARLFEAQDKIPDYTFNELLNGNKKQFRTLDRKKPIILKFWATWCAPCLPAMDELVAIQKKFGNDVDIITVSTDTKENLLLYIKNTNTPLTIAYDTSHLAFFPYQFVPYTILVDRDGFIKATATTEKLTDIVVYNLINGKEVEFEHSNVNINHKNTIDTTFVNEQFEFNISGENKNRRFKNKITYDETKKASSLEFNNVSIHRLFADIYQLTSVARIYNKELVSPNKKYCFNLRHINSYPLDLLSHAQEILNANLDITARIETIKKDSILLLQVVDSTHLPKATIHKNTQIEFRGPSYKGRHINTRDLISYLENETQQVVLDGTSIDYLFDISLDWQYENPKSLNEQLGNYGLQIKRSKVPQDVNYLVLYELKE